MNSIKEKCFFSNREKQKHPKMGVFLKLHCSYSDKSKNLLVTSSIFREISSDLSFFISTIN